jgi:Ulp1 family protease
MSNPLIINYHDACIYQSDLDILKQNGSWLNDTIMLFEMTHLSVTFGAKTSHRIRYLDPSVVEFFMHSLSLTDEDDLEEFQNLYNKWCNVDCNDDVILLVPLNDNNSRGFDNNSNGAVGNHWSLLAVVITKDWDGAFHFDSSSGYNMSTAEVVFERIMDIIEIGRRNKPKILHRLVECNVPQQQNGYDCGVHTLLTAECFSTSDAIDSPLSNMDFSSVKNMFEARVRNFMKKYENTYEMGRLKRREILKKVRMEVENL